MKKMKIYDCFTFYNELDLLKLRFQNLDNYVDYFVLVEADKTHSGKKKGLYFNKNKKLFKKWNNKIIHIVVKDMPKINKLGEFIQKSGDKMWNPIIPIPGLIIHLGIGRWKPERFQRNQIIRGLKKCNDEDIILVSDVDEIPNPKKFPQMIHYLKNEKRVGFKQKEFHHYLNGFITDGWIGTKACTFKTLRKDLHSKPQRIRSSFWDSNFLKKILFSKKKLKLIESGGWHFSYTGGFEKIIKKISSLAHAEIDSKEFKNKERMEKLLKEGKDLFGNKIKYLKIDKSFPEALIKHKKEYPHLIKTQKKNEISKI